MVDPAVHASIISVAGEWAKVVIETTEPRTKLSRAKAHSLLRHDFESAYKELVMAVQILEKDDK